MAQKESPRIHLRFRMPMRAVTRMLMHATKLKLGKFSACAMDTGQRILQALDMDEPWVLAVPTGTVRRRDSPRKPSHKDIIDREDVSSRVCS